MSRAQKYNMTRSILTYVENHKDVTRKEISENFGHLVSRGTSRIIYDLIHVRGLLSSSKKGFLSVTDEGRKTIEKESGYGAIYTPETTTPQPNTPLPSPKSTHAESAMDSLAKLLQQNDRYRETLERIAYLIDEALKD